MYDAYAVVEKYSISWYTFLLHLLVEAELLMILIEKYEDDNYPIESPDPIEAIKFRMEQMDMKKKDLASVLGYRSRVTEILSKRRKLTLKMIRNLHEKLNIPYESLIQDYQLIRENHPFR